MSVPRVARTLLMLAAVLTASAPASASEAPEQSVEFHTPIFTMDRVYGSMFGPMDSERLALSSAPTEGAEAAKRPEVFWITGIRADVVGSKGEAESPEYFCHSNLSLATSQPRNRLRIFGREKPNKRKMFTLVQGQSEIRFPPGFGMPVLSNDRFDSQVMVMNPSQPEEPVRVGVESRIDFVRHADLKQEMKPLYVISLPLMVAVQQEESPLAALGHAEGESCLDDDVHAGHETTAVAVDPTVIGRRSTLRTGTSGETLAGAWYVPPGRHVYRHQLGTLSRRIPSRTRAHYVSAHLHPFGESIELIDRTTGKSVFKATAKNYPDRVALQEITHYSGVEGIPLDPSHDYELVAVYDNTTGESIDSMAVIYLYLHDTLLRLPSLRGS